MANGKVPKLEERIHLIRHSYHTLLHWEVNPCQVVQAKQGGNSKEKTKSTFFQNVFFKARQL